MRKYILHILIGVGLISCSGETTTIFKDVNALPVSLIYMGDTVIKFAKALGEANAEVAIAYTKKGEEAEATNPEKAIYYYKRAITLGPTQERYLKLAKVLEANGLKNELAELYYFLVIPFTYKYGAGNDPLFVFRKPDFDLYYEYLVAHIIKNQSLWSEDVYLAKEQGFDTEAYKKKLLSEPRIGMDTSSMTFKNMLLQFLSYEEFEQASKDPGMFRNFVSTASDTTLNFSISEKQVGKFDYLSNLGSDDFMQNDFSSIYRYYLVEQKEENNIWFKFNLTHHLQLSEKFTTLICAIDTSYPGSPPEMRNIYHRLVTYDSAMKVIDHRVIAVHSGEQLSTVDFRKNKFNIHSFKRTFRKPYKKGEFDNEVMGLVLEEETYFEINEAGQIIKIDPASAM
jgi:hypothetical protein